MPPERYDAGCFRFVYRMLFLHADGVGTSQAVRIFKAYGQEPIAVITEEFYSLARDIRGIGLSTADKVAAELGIVKEAMIRARARHCSHR